MRCIAVSALLALVAVQQAVATYEDSAWGQCAPGFPTCSKSPNQCTDHQKGGIAADDPSLPSSGSCTSIGGMSVSGASYGNMPCKNPRAKRSVKFPRTGDHHGSENKESSSSHQKCILGEASASRGIQVHKGSGQGYSCTSHDIITSEDCSVLFVHQIPGQSKPCTYSQQCSKNTLTTVQNTNCGNSTSHEILINSVSGAPSKATIGVVSMNFNCIPYSSTCSSSPAENLSTSHKVLPSSSPVSSLPYTPSAKPSSSFPHGSVPSNGTSPSITPSPSSTSALSEVGSTTAPSAQSTVEQVISEIVYTTITTCPVTTTQIEGGSTAVGVTTTISTVLVTDTVTVCTKCVAPPKTTSSSVPVPESSTPGSPSESGSSSPAPVSSIPGSPSQLNPTVSSPVTSTSDISHLPVIYTLTTEVVYTTLTTCPVTNTVTPPNGPPSKVITSSISTVVGTSTSIYVMTSSTPAPSPVQSASSLPLASPSSPPTLQKCIASWFDLKGCGSNTDYECYCQHDEVTTHVFECITSYEQQVEAQQQAVQSYQAICAKYIPKHIAIITKSVELIPIPASTAPAQAGVASSPVAPAEAGVTLAPFSPANAGVTSAPAAVVASGVVSVTSAPSSLPSTTVTISTVVTIPCSADGQNILSQIPDGQVQAYASIMAPGCTTTSLLSTSVVVGQQYFSTSGSSVGLAAGTPAPNHAAATAGVGSPAGVPGQAAVTGSFTPSAATPSAATPSAATSSTALPTASVTNPFLGAAAQTRQSGIFLSVAIAVIGLVVYA